MHCFVNIFSHPLNYLFTISNSYQQHKETCFFTSLPAFVVAIIFIVTIVTDVYWKVTVASIHIFWWVMKLNIFSYSCLQSINPLWWNVCSYNLLFHIMYCLLLLLLSFEISFIVQILILCLVYGLQICIPNVSFIFSFSKQSISQANVCSLMRSIFYLDLGVKSKNTAWP